MVRIKDLSVISSLVLVVAVFGLSYLAGRLYTRFAGIPANKKTILGIISICIIFFILGILAVLITYSFL